MARRPTLMARFTGRSLWYVLWLECLPFPGRLRTAVLLASTATFTAALCDWAHTMLPAYSLYFGYFSRQADARKTITAAIVLILASALALVFIGNLQAILISGSAGLRIAMLCVWTIGGFFLAKTSKLGPIAMAVSFLVAFVLTQTDVIPVPELISRFHDRVWITVLFGMLPVIMTQSLFGDSSLDLLGERLIERLTAAADFMDERTLERKEWLTALLREGDDYLLDRFASAGLSTRGVLGEQYRNLIGISGRLIFLCSGLNSLSQYKPDEQPFSIISRNIRKLSYNISKKRPFLEFKLDCDLCADASFRDGELLIAREIIGLMNASADPIDAPTLVPSNAPKQKSAGFFAPDSFTNPNYLKFSLKVCGAVLICYFTYRILNWPEISTALVTCFFVALNSVEETLHKASLRIAGALSGGLLGIFAILWIMPYLTDFGQFLCLIFFGAFIAGWFSSGSERIAYFGWQLALAFFLSVLSGPENLYNIGPTLDMQTARDRVVGIILGNVVMACVFLTVWPVSIATNLRAALDRARNTLADLYEVLALRGQLSADEVNAKSTVAVTNLRAAIGAANRATNFLAFMPKFGHMTYQDRNALNELDAIEFAMVPAIILACDTSRASNNALVTADVSRLRLLASKLRRLDIDSATSNLHGDVVEVYHRDSGHDNDSEFWLNALFQRAVSLRRSGQ